MSHCPRQSVTQPTTRRGFTLATAACVLLPTSVNASGSAAASTVSVVPLAPLAKDSPVQHSRLALLGTQVDLIVSHPEPARRERALEAAWREMLRLNEMMSRYRSASQVSLLARCAGESPLPIAPELMQVLLQAQQLRQSSDGHFDIRVGTYSDWHFEAGAAAQRPAAQTLLTQARLARAAIELDPQRGTARLAQAGLQIDLGGVAKLPILEAGLRAVQALGIREALINGGGDVLCCGGLQGRPWRIGLRDPLAPERLLGVLPLHEGVVAASGDYERGFDLAGRRYHHVIDPCSGEPSQGLHGLALVSSSVTAVNGWGAAMMVAGADQAKRWLRGPDAQPGLRGVEAMLASDAGHWLSAGLRQRLAQRPVG